MVSDERGTAAQLIDNFSLNPCCNGIWSQTLLTISKIFGRNPS